MEKLSEVCKEVVGFFSKDARRTRIILCGSIVILITVDQVVKYYKMRTYFKKLNIRSPKPWPLVGNFLDLWKKGLTEHDEYLIRDYGKIAGYFEGLTPNILTTDIKFIKTITIKDFNYFINRRTMDVFMIEPFDKFISVIKDEEWKNVRSIISTTFTSGKLKAILAKESGFKSHHLEPMTKCLIKCANEVSEVLEETASNDEVFDAKKLFGSYTLDTIASCCFGIDTNAVKQKDNEFLKHLQIVFSNSVFKNPKILLFFCFPTLTVYLTKNNLIDFVPKKSFKMLTDAMEEILLRRRQNLERREDFIQNMVDHEGDLKKDTSPKKTDLTEKVLHKKLTNGEIISNALLFFIAGYETTATTLSFIAYNLAKNPDCQERLFEEVDEVLAKHNGEVSYESVNEMDYMEMVIDETLRMYPPAIRTDRVACADYEYEGVKIPKGQIVSLSIWAVHHDPEVYPNPEEFDPQRFSEEQKKLRDNETFLPFGNGPRNCIGMRFAYLEIKILLATVLSKYKIVTCEQTTEKMEIDIDNLTKPKNPIIVKVVKRTKN